MGRMNTYLVTLRWQYGRESFDRRIAESGLSRKSAALKVMAKYTGAKMVARLGKPELISVIDYWGS